LREACEANYILDKTVMGVLCRLVFCDWRAKLEILQGSFVIRLAIYFNKIKLF